LLLATAADEPWMQTPDPLQVEAAPVADDMGRAAPEPAVLPEPEAWTTPRPAGPAAAVPAEYADPGRLFDPLVAGPVLGALLLDTRGMVLAGELPAQGRAADALAAVLGSVTGEATRTAALLELGHWQGLLLETGDALLHIAPAGPEAVILLVARAGAPAGWIMRSAAHAATLAQAFLEAYA